MRATEPIAELDRRFSVEHASPTPWEEAREQLEQAEVYWVSTVRRDARPHVTPLIAVWQDDALVFCTGPTEQKARNLQTNRNCILTTGCNRIGEGLDVVLEGEAVRVFDDARLGRIAEAYVAKYGEAWRFEVDGGTFRQGDTVALVFEVAPRRAFAFRKGDEFSQTRWRFDDAR
jgi:hypothetical protein